MIKANNLLLAVPLVIAMLAPQVSGENSYVSHRHPLFPTDRGARTKQIENLHKYEQFVVKTAQDFQQTFRQLIFLHRSLKKVAQERSDQNGVTKFLKFRARQAERAHKCYPHSPAIAGVYAWYKYNAENTIGKSIATIVPYLQQLDFVPGLARTMYSIFAHEHQSFSTLDKERYTSAFGLARKESRAPKEVMKFLKIYWATQIDPSYSDNWTEERVAEYQQKLTPEKRHVALRAWRHLIAVVYEARQIQVKQEVNAQRIRQRRKKSTPRKSYKQKLQERLKQAKEDAKSTLKSWEKRPNKLREIMDGISNLSTVKRLSDDWDEEQLPNYDTIKEKLGHAEAETLNLFYSGLVLGKSRQAIRGVSQVLEERPDDTRLLMLKAWLLREKNKLTQAQKVLDKILEFDPKHRMARNTLWRLMKKTQSEEAKSASE